MNSRKVKLELEQHIIFIDCFIPYDFTKLGGQLALEIKYTNGDTQMFTTASTLPNHSSTYEFDNDEEYFKYISYLKEQGVPQGKVND